MTKLSYLGLACVFLAYPARAGQAKRLGEVDFRVSCAASVQGEFSTAVAYLHSFQYSQATQTFQDIAKRDPQCSMAYWGLAMSLYQQIWTWPDAATMAKGLGYVRTAERLGGKTARERDYIASMAAFYQDDPKLSPAARREQYAKAMEKAFRDNPTDVNAGAFYALSLVALAQAGIDDLPNRKRAIAVLQKLFAATPDNPGVDHYFIHAADTSELAPQALAAARNYAKIAPDSAHALHMPSHIFTRLGYWQDSIRSNRASAAAAEAETRSQADNQVGYELHAMTYLEYAYLQSGENQQAMGVIARIPSVPGDSALELEEVQDLFRITYAMENHDWKAASQLSLPPKDAYPADHQNLYWARAIGAARLGDVAAARQDLAELRRVYAAVPAGRRGADQRDRSYLLEAEAWTDYADGQAASAEKSMREAVAGQSRTESDELGIPAAEMLGDLLTALHKPALPAYEQALKEDPNRFDSLYGAARAAEAEQKPAEAAKYYRLLLKISGPTADRKEVQQATAYLAKTASPSAPR